MYCNLGAKKKRPKAREDHGLILFVFASACVVGKNPNTPNWSSMADNTITQGGMEFWISSLDLWVKWGPNPPFNPNFLI